MPDGAGYTSPFRLLAEPILVRGEVSTTVRNYEALYIIDATSTDEKVDAVIAKFSKLIVDQGGEVQAAGRWDRRRLAYEIKGYRDGLYILMYFTGEAAASNELDRMFKIDDNIIRHLITRVEPQHIDVSRIEQQQQQPAAAAVEPIAAPVEEVAAEVEEAPAVEAEVPAEEPAAVAEEATPAAEEVAAEEPAS